MIIGLNEFKGLGICGCLVEVDLAVLVNWGAWEKWCVEAACALYLLDRELLRSLEASLSHIPKMQNDAANKLAR